MTSLLVSMVALRKESVDRNHLFASSGVDFASLSARRAWIEINMWCSAGKPWVVALRKESVDRNGQSIPNILTLTAVALRKESVDRNHVRYTTSPRPSMSLSARRAWIEMWLRCWKLAARDVALRKESVDRNAFS